MIDGQAIITLLSTFFLQGCNFFVAVDPNAEIYIPGSDSKHFTMSPPQHTQYAQYRITKRGQCNVKNGQRSLVLCSSNVTSTALWVVDCVGLLWRFLHILTHSSAKKEKHYNVRLHPGRPSISDINVLQYFLFFYVCLMYCLIFCFIILFK